jgi:hypothetical protein
MSEIPFVNRLGDAVESAITAPRPARRRLFGRRRRIGVLALAVLLAGASGVTVARIAADPDQVAAGTVACYEHPDRSGNVAVPGVVVGSPTDACAKAWSDGPVPPLVACLHGIAVAVIPGRDAADCRAAGLEALPPGYATSQAKVARLERDLAAVEATADCIPARELVSRAQAVLDRSGWEGWRAVSRPGDGGPCGAILTRDGTGKAVTGGALRADIRRLEVHHGPPRSLEERLYGAQSLNARLMDASGARCFTIAELEALASRMLAATGRPLTFKLGHLPANTGIEPPRGTRYEEGCAIAIDAAPVYPAPGKVEIEVELWRKGL